MRFSVNSFITPQAAAKLLFTDEIDLCGSWSCEQATDVLNALLAMPIEQILNIIDETEDRLFDATTIPQFGKIDTLIKVPMQLSDTGTQLNYAQLGFLLKKDMNASLEANTKFGENHGKGAALTGIVNCIDKRITTSALSSGFCAISDLKTQELIVVKLYFRIPIVQEILKHAARGQYNGFDAMTLIMENTKKRRSQCLRQIFKSMEIFQDDALNARLQNIVWNIE